MNFFVEAGYEFANSKNQDATLTEEDYLLGDPEPLPEGMKTSSKTKYISPYIGLGINYKLPKYTNTSLFALAGISVTKVFATYKSTGTDSNPTPSQPILSRTFKKHKVNPIIKVGVNHKLSRHFDLRLVGTWYKLNNITKLKPL